MQTPELFPFIVGIFTTLFAVAGMQFKNMKIIIISQLLANGLLGFQYILEGQISTSGIVIVAIVQTITSFIFSANKKDFPVWLTIVFMGAFTVVSVLMYSSLFDILTLVAVWFFAVSIVQKNSAICRICAFCNTLLWLIYDIALAPSAILTHSVIITFIVVAMIRNDIPEWKKLIKKLVKKLK